MSSHLSYEGQTKLDYCLECAVKHGQTAKVLMREALQRAEASDPSAEGVKEKVRGAVEELSGFEDDTNTVENQTVIDLNQKARDLRKLIYSKQCEVGACQIEDLRDVKKLINILVDEVYNAKAKEACPTCVIKAENESEPEKVEAKPDYSEYGKSLKEKREALIAQIRSEMQK
jgi:hypothetical protein